MKVLHVTPWYAPAWSTGGVAVASTNLCEELASLGCQITVFTTLDGVDTEFLNNKNKSIILNGVKVNYFKSSLFGSSFRSACFSIPLIIKLFSSVKDYDLCHIHSTRTIYGLFIFLICKFFKKPYIITPHATLMEYWMKFIGYPRLKLIYSKIIDKHILKNASKLHFLTKYEQISSKNYCNQN